MTHDDLMAYLAEWRSMEDRFYRSILNSADLYMLGIRLVRRIADQLVALSNLAALVEHFQHSSSDDVIAIADALDTPQVVVLDYQLARGAAFYIRAQEIQAVVAQVGLQQRVTAARATGDDWVILYEHETRRYGKAFFQRMEMHLPDGFALFTSSELDWEKGRVFLLETMHVDLTTGQRLPDSASAPPVEYATHEELLQAAEAMRHAYKQSSPQLG